MPSSLDNRTWDTVKLRGSSRDTRILVAGHNQTPQRNLIQFLSRAGGVVTDASFTRNSNIFNNA